MRCHVEILGAEDRDLIEQRVPTPCGINKFALDEPWLTVVDEPHDLHFEVGHPQDVSEAA
jgi:hypothetical protein